MAGWSKGPTAFIKVVEEDLAKKRTHIAVDALQAVISGSPVDDGTYRMNHRVTVDSEDHGFDPQAGRGKDVEPPKGSLNVSSYDAGLKIIAEGADEAYATVTIQNNLPYAEVLENGHSQQAPQGVYGPAYEAVRSKYVK